MVDVLDRQVELVSVVFDLAAILGTAISQDPQRGNAVLGVERDHPVIQQIGCRDRRLFRVELGLDGAGIGVDKGLLPFAECAAFVYRARG